MSWTAAVACMAAVATGSLALRRWGGAAGCLGLGMPVAAYLMGAALAAAV